MRKSIYAIAIPALALVCQACDMKEYTESSQLRGVRFGVTLEDLGSVLGTKSSELVSKDGSVSIPLTYEFSDGIGSGLVEEPVTKGKQYNSTSQEQPLSNFHNDVKFFYSVAWNSDDSRFIPAASSASSYDKVSYNSGQWKASAQYDWTNKDTKTFFAYANLPASGATVSYADNASQALTYTVPSTAVEQTDIMLGYYKGDGGDLVEEGQTDGLAEILFYHPLTAVRFLQGEFVGCTGIKSISLNGVINSGNTTQTGTTGKDFVWTDLGDADLTVSQTLSSTSLPGVGKMIGEAFLLIPQDITSNPVVLNVTVTTESGDLELSANLDHGEWKVGQTNTYTLGYDVQSYDYTFKLNVESDGERTYQNQNTASNMERIDIISTKVRDGESEEIFQDWIIKSYKVGDAEPVPVNANEVNDAGGIYAVHQGSSLLYIKALPRNIVNKQINSYWINKDGRTDDLGWSPEDWTDETRNSAIDLSKYDYHKEGALDTYSEAQSKGAFNNLMTTANCYIIRHAGTYKLPLVYGNGIKKGTDNVQSYSPTIKVTSTQMTPFVNHLDNGIISPFIEYNTTDGLEKGDGNAYLTPDGYEVVWQDESNALTISGLSKETVTVGGVDYSVSYLTFNVSQDLICQNNAVIAVKDSNGDIMWSWHIWMTNNPDLLEPDIVVENYSGTYYNFFPLSGLGWVDSPSYPGREDVEIVLKQLTSGQTITILVHQLPVKQFSNGTYYQYGRKDPICRKDGVLGFEISPDIKTSENASQYTFGYAIKHPGMMLCNSNGRFYGHISDNIMNMWTGTIASSKSVTRSQVVKTIYDPSPSGYMLPDPGAFTGFTFGIEAITNTSATPGNYLEPDISVYNGFMFYTKTDKSNTIYFPINGVRQGKDGVRAINDGHYVTLGSYTNSAYGLYFGKADTQYIKVYQGSTWTNARGVRPVRE
ncbi:MAG: hypothetical protein Q4G10_05540 [Bacteroidia bacterium]|nr:hypothetical protein [Bacteroidia bacterium]